MNELATRSPRSTPESALSGELIDPRGLAVRAAEVAARQRSPETRRTYAAVYRSFGAFLGPEATVAAVTPEAVGAYHDALEQAGRSPATVAKHLSALRGLAAALEALDRGETAFVSARRLVLRLRASVPPPASRHPRPAGSYVRVTRGVRAAGGVTVPGSGWTGERNVGSRLPEPGCPNRCPNAPTTHRGPAGWVAFPNVAIVDASPL